MVNTDTPPGHSTSRHVQWRRIVDRLAADRMGARAKVALPRAVAGLALGALLAAHEQWPAEVAGPVGGTHR
jgi:MftR C-terminal domain